MDYLIAKYYNNIITINARHHRVRILEMQKPRENRSSLLKIGHKSENPSAIDVYGPSALFGQQNL